MSDQEKPSNPEQVNWDILEGEMQVVERRAKAIYWGQLQQGANELGALLGQVLPEGTLEAFEDTASPSPREPVIGADGNLVITTPGEAYELAKQRPELAAIMAQTAYNETIVEQQQLDMKADEEVDEERAGLQAKIERIEFWSAVVALHPINMDLDYIQENIVSQFGGAKDPDEQVRLCVSVEDAMVKAQGFAADWSPARIAIRREQYEELYKEQPEPSHRGELEWVDRMEKKAEESHVEIDTYSRFLGGVVYGLTFPDGNPALTVRPEEPEEPKNLEAPNEYYELLRTLPGTDPVVAIMEGRLKDLPKSGWIIRSEVQPGSTGGGVTITRYEKGGFTVNDHMGSLSDGEVQIDCTFEADKHGDYTLSYLKGRKGGTWVYDGGTTADPQHEIDLGGGRIIRGNSAPMRAGINKADEYLEWASVDNVIDWTNKYGSEDDNMPAKMIRITDDSDEARKVIDHLARAMGMKDGEAAQFVGVLEEKEVFEPLKAETATERARRERERQLRDQEVIVDYGDGSVLVDRGTEHVMIEADGSEWVQYSNGIIYSGPHDLIGEYPE